MNGKEPFGWDRRHVHLPSPHPGSLNLGPAFPIITFVLGQPQSSSYVLSSTLGQPRQRAVGEASDRLPAFLLSTIFACKQQHDTTGCVGLTLSLLMRIDVVLSFAYYRF